MIRFACASCQKTLTAPEDKAGMRFACPGCKQPVEVPKPGAITAAAPTPSGEPRGAVHAFCPAISGPSFGKQVGDECLAIGMATFRQTLKPITYVFEIMRRYQLQKKTAEAKQALSLRLYESKLGDAKVRARIAALNERIQGIQDVKGDAKPAIAERKGMLVQLADPFLKSEKVPEAVETEHERARDLSVKLKSQEDALAGALGGMLPPNGAAWRRVAIGYTITLLVLFGTVYTLGVWPFNREAPISMAMAAQQTRAAEEADWAKERNSEQIVDKCAPSVALIRFKLGKNEGGGTGFMIRPGVVATNAHVIDNMLPEQLKVYFPSHKELAKTPHSAQVIYFDRKRDLAFLSVDAPKVPILRLADNFEFRSGRNITIIGCPGMGETQLENAVNVGVLSTKTEVEKMAYYQLGAPVNPGNSGGPVFDNKGHVIGVVTLKASHQESLSFCIPWQDLKDRLEALEKEDPHKVAVGAQAMQHLHVVVDRVENCAIIYARVMQMYAFAMENAARRGRPVQEGINEARLNVDNFIRKVAPFMMDTQLTDIGKKLLNDPNVPPEIRDKFSALWNTYLQFKAQYDKPTGPASTYMTTQQRLVHQFGKDFEAMREALGFEKRKRDDDDDF